MITLQLVDMSKLADVINEVWFSIYGGEAVTDEFALEMRIRNLAEDRNNWAFNTKVLQKAYNELDEKLRSQNDK